MEHLPGVPDDHRVPFPCHLDVDLVQLVQPNAEGVDGQVPALS